MGAAAPACPAEQTGVPKPTHRLIANQRRTVSSPYDFLRELRVLSANSAIKSFNTMQASNLSHSFRDAPKMEQPPLLSFFPRDSQPLQPLFAAIPSEDHGKSPRNQRSAPRWTASRTRK